MAQTNPIQAQKFLGGMNYPVSKNETFQHAEGQGTDDGVLSFLRQIPDLQYDCLNAVSHEISEAP